MKKKILLFKTCIVGINFFFLMNAQNSVLTYTPTWADDIAPIFYNHCTTCHHPGGIAQFSLIDYNSAFIYKNSIKYAVLNGKMPPWPPDTSYTRFIGERILSQQEIQKIVDWVNGGAPQGNINNAPPAPTYTNTYHLPGTPDLEIKIPQYTSKATTYDEYVCFSIPLNNSNLRYIKALEIVPGNKSIVHHVILTADTSSSKPSSVTIDTNCYSIPNPTAQIGIAGYDPGTGPVVLPSISPYKFGIPLYPNSNLLFQIHYPKGSVGKLDSTKVRLYFYPINEPDIREVYTLPLLYNGSLLIPPNTIQTFTNECLSWGIYSNCTFPFDLTFFACNPHQHLIGKSLVNFAVSPNLQDTIKLIRINNWDFNWQGYYWYKKPIKIPAGYKLVGFHTYDNTSSNPNNPFNPPDTIKAGLQTTDEMFFDSFVLTYYLPGDENINTDSLITVSVKEFYEKQTLKGELIIYPNPCENYVYVEINRNKVFSIRIKDLSGKVLKDEKVFNGHNLINLSELSNGLYFVELWNGSYLEDIKKLVVLKK
jgi:hypothetical protein